MYSWFAVTVCLSVLLAFVFLVKVVFMLFVFSSFFLCSVYDLIINKLDAGM